MACHVGVGEGGGRRQQPGALSPCRPPLPLQRQCRNTFNPESSVTVGAAFLAHTLALPSGVSVKFEIW